MASLGAVQALSLALPLLSLPYLANVLGPGGLGRVAFALSAAQIVAMVSDYGFELTASRRASMHRDDAAALTRLWCVVGVLRLLLALAGLAGMGVLALAHASVRDELFLIGVACTVVAGPLVYPHWLFQGTEQLRGVSVLQLLARLGCFAALFVLVRGEDDVRWAVFLQAAPLLVTGLLALPLTLRYLRGSDLAWPTMASLQAELREGQHVFWSSAAVAVYTTCNTFLLGLALPAQVVGQYHVAEKIIRAVQSLYGPISHAVYPHVVRLAAGSVQDALRFNRTLLAMLASASALLGLGVFIAAGPLVLWLAGEGFADSASLLRVFAWLPLIVVLSNVFGVQTMLPLGMERSFKRILLLSAALDLALFFPAIQSFGAWGAAWVNVIVELFVVACMAMTLHRAGCSPLNDWRSMDRRERA